MSATTPPGNIRLDFSNLPLAEVATRITFAEPVRLTYVSINRIHSGLAELPSIREPTSLEMPAGVPGVVSFSPGDIPGAIYSGPDGMEVDLQRHVLVVRWRRSAAPPKAEYPRFEHLRGLLTTSFSALRDAIGQVPAVRVANMSYVNRFEIATPGELLALLRVKADGFSRAKRISKIEAAWREGEDLDVRFRVERAAGDEQPKTTYLLHTIAGRFVERGAPWEPVLDHVHRELQTFFLSVITEYAADLWKLMVRNA